MNTYEIMFLFDPTAGANWAAVESEIGRLMERAEAEVIVTRRLEERRLAYEIAGRKRGLYVLTYFRVKGDRIASLERDARLSEMILRVLILRAEDLSEEKMRSATLAGVAKEASPPQAETPSGGGENAAGDTAKSEDKKANESAPEKQDSEGGTPPELVGSATEESDSTEP